MVEREKTVGFSERRDAFRNKLKQMETLSKNKMFRYGFFILRKLVSHGFQAHIVGGSLRNLYLDIPVKDVDICTNATPADIKEIFNGFTIVCVGESFGTTNVIIDEIPFEITTYRGETYTEDSRKPSCVFNPSGDSDKDLINDLVRRDFSMNTLIMDVDGVVSDHFGGIEHMTRKIIYPIGIEEIDADRMFKDDPLRILRAFRFSAQLDFVISGVVKKAIEKNARRLKSISHERVRDELTKLLKAPHRSRLVQVLKEMYELGVWEHIMPEIVDTFGFNQNNMHHDFTLDMHTAIAVHNSPMDEHVRWAAFLHDIGKLETVVQKESGEFSFPGHAHESEKIATKILRRLCFSNYDVGMITKLIKYHDLRFCNFKNKAMRKVVVDLGKDGVSKLFDLWSADVYSQKHGAVCQAAEADLRIAMAKLIEFINSDKNVGLVDMEINGKDIMELGAKEGKIIGTILKQLNDWVVDGIVPNDKKVLIKNAKNLLTNWSANGNIISSNKDIKN